MVILARTFFPPPGGNAVPNPELIQKMEAKDRLVHAHERAHCSVAGRYAQGAIEYTYQEGPDGKLYAVGGHVNIDTSVPDDPEECIRKMEIVRRSAMAPTSIGDVLSNADQQIAALASRHIEEAKGKLAQRVQEAQTQGQPKG